jgi:hypothetical protein
MSLVHLVYRSSGPALCGKSITEVDAEYEANAPLCEACEQASMRHNQERYGLDRPTRSEDIPVTTDLPHWLKEQKGRYYLYDHAAWHRISAALFVKLAQEAR